MPAELALTQPGAASWRGWWRAGWAPRAQTASPRAPASYATAHPAYSVPCPCLARPAGPRSAARLPAHLFKKTVLPAPVTKRMPTCRPSNLRPLRLRAVQLLRTEADTTRDLNEGFTTVSQAHNCAPGCAGVQAAVPGQAHAAGRASHRACLSWARH